MNLPRSRRSPLIFLGAALTALTITGASAVNSGAAAATRSTSLAPTADTENGIVRGLAVPGADAFLGLPYAAPPTGRLRWRTPQPAVDWKGVRDASVFAPSCPQLPSPFIPAGTMAEDCLYLNVYRPAPDSRRDAGHPVLVWIHGGGLTEGAGRSYDPTKLATEGTVVVTINYRLGPLGFLAHPALASRPGGPSGNYGLMDQQAALRWVQRNIGEFGGDPYNVTIAGQSAGGLSVLAQVVSPSSRGLFQRAIVESGSFALTQQSLAAGESLGQAVAAAAGCPDQTAACLRGLPVDALLNKFPPFAIPGVVDGQVLKESIGSALAAGRFTRVPILNGVNHDEERLFIVATKVAVSGGTFVPVTEPVTDANYEQNIGSILGVSSARAAAIAGVYPTSAYFSPEVALSALVSDANFACTALQMDEWTSRLVPTFAYEFDDDAAPPRYAPLTPPVATHTSELPYLFNLPDAALQGPLSPAQEQLASSMRMAWADFAAEGNPATESVPWPSFNHREHEISLVSPQPRFDAGFASRHHCGLWNAG
jgi:para-nitrobenzyl esterase